MKTNGARPPRRIGYEEAEALCARLAAEVRGRLGDEIGRWSFRPIPRGGLIVLGMLSYLLGLRREQVEPSGEPAPRRVVLVDDLASSGARFGETLPKVGADEVAFVHLLSHPRLRSAIVGAEPRVAFCLAAEDLCERTDAPASGDEAFWDRWRARLPGRRYWLGAVEPVAFAWSAPDVVFWDAAEGRVDDGWRRGSPDASLDAWVAAGLPGPRRATALHVPEGVAWRTGEGCLRLRAGDRCYGLDGTGLEMWRALLAFGPGESAVARLTELFDAPEPVLAADLAAFSDRLVDAGLLRLRPTMNGATEAARAYPLHGVRVRSELPLPAPEDPAASGTPDLVIRLVEGGPPPAAAGEPSYESDVYTREGEPLLRLFPAPGADLLRFAGVADFEIDDREVRVRLADGARPEMAGVRLLGSVVPFWLERRGVPCLHASAVVVDGAAVAFLGGNRAGKSSLAAALVARGRPLLADDMVAVELDTEGRYRARPAYPQMRLWPEQAERFVGRSADLPTVHPATDKRRVRVGPGGFGAFCDRARPLACLYLPERIGSGGRVRIEPVGPADAGMELLRRSHLPRLVEAAGLQPDRMERLAGLVEQVPVRRLVYPEGYERFDRVLDTVLADLSSLRAAPVSSSARSRRLE